MNKLCLTRAIAWLSLMSFAILASSCVNDEYDMSGDNLNKDVTLFEDGVTLPLGTTEQIKMKDLLKDVNTDVLQVGENGEYYVDYSGSFEMDKDLASVAGLVDVNIPNVDLSQDVTFSFFDSGAPVPHFEIVVIDKLETDIKESIEVEFLSAKDMPKELKSLGVITVGETYINLAMDASPFMSKLGSAKLTVDFDMTLPEIIRLAGQESNVLKLSGVADEKGVVKIDPVRVEAFDVNTDALGQGVKDVIKVDGTVKLSDLPEDLSMDVVQSLMGELSFGFDVSLKNADSSKKDIEIKKVTGKVDYRFDPVVQDVDLSDINELLGDSGSSVNLDFYRALLGLEAVTNFGVPVVADMVLVPYYGGRPDESRSIAAAVALNASPSADKDAVTKYTFDEEDVLGLIRKLPEKLELRVDACTDPKKEAVVEPGAEYRLAVGYNMNIPMEFGEDFNISFTTELNDLPEIFGSLLSNGNKVTIAGSVENSLPLGFDLRISARDSRGADVPLADGAGVQKISPCGAGGSAVKTELGITLALKDGAASDDIASLDLVFNANSEGAAGIPVTEDAYLQAVLQLVLPEGITVDLGDIKKNEQ